MLARFRLFLKVGLNGGEMEKTEASQAGRGREGPHPHPALDRANGNTEHLGELVLGCKVLEGAG